MAIQVNNPLLWRLQNDVCTVITTALQTVGYKPTIAVLDVTNYSDAKELIGDIGYGNPCIAITAFSTNAQDEGNAKLFSDRVSFTIVAMYSGTQPRGERIKHLYKWFDVLRYYFQSATITQDDVKGIEPIKVLRFTPYEQDDSSYCAIDCEFTYHGHMTGTTV